MGCHESGYSNEHEFVAQVTRSRADIWSCCGPRVTLAFSPVRLAEIEDALKSPSAHDLLWGGYDPAPIDAMYFTLCALHWMEIACLLSLRGYQFQCEPWRSEGSSLLEDLCREISWDAKEIANAFTWQRLRLT